MDDTDYSRVKAMLEKAHLMFDEIKDKYYLNLWIHNRITGLYVHFCFDLSGNLVDVRAGENNP